MDHPLVIVGGGPAGCATALALVAAAPELAGQVAIVDQARFPREKICAGAIGARGDLALARLGLRVEVPGVELRGIEFVGAPGTRLVRREAPIGRVVRRREFDAALVEEVRGRGIAVHEGVRVLGLERRSRGVRLATSRGDLRAQAIVGADGVGSVVRRALGLPRGRLRAQVVEVDTEAIAGDPPREILRFDFLDRDLTGYAWDFATVVDGEPLVCRGLYQLAFVGREPAQQRDVGALLEERLARQGARRRGPIKRFAERGLVLAEPVALPRALLVGEAAGIDPFLGEGITQAILYGALAGPYLARKLRDRELGFGDWPAVLGASSLGRQLAFRSFVATQVAYSPSLRPLAERWACVSDDFLAVGMRYFAGEALGARAVAAELRGLALALLSRR